MIGITPVLLSSIKVIVHKGNLDKDIVVGFVSGERCEGRPQRTCLSISSMKHGKTVYALQLHLQLRPRYLIPILYKYIRPIAAAGHHCRVDL